MLLDLYFFFYFYIKMVSNLPEDFKSSTKISYIPPLHPDFPVVNILHLCRYPLLSFSDMLL